jgi:peptidoglycan/LPS O-acetylase OafA/YrhL
MRSVNLHIFGAIIFAVASDRSGLWNPALRVVGEASYSLCVLRLNLLGPSASVEAWRRGGWFYAVHLSIAVGASSVAYKYMEKPANRYLGSLWANNKQSVGLPVRTV